MCDCVVLLLQEYASSGVSKSHSPLIKSRSSKMTNTVRRTDYNKSQSEVGNSRKVMIEMEAMRSNANTRDGKKKAAGKRKIFNAHTHTTYSFEMDQTGERGKEFDRRRVRHLFFYGIFRIFLEVFYITLSIRRFEKERKGGREEAGKRERESKEEREEEEEEVKKKKKELLSNLLVTAKIEVLRPRGGKKKF